MHNSVEFFNLFQTVYEKCPPTQTPTQNFKKLVYDIQFLGNSLGSNGIRRVGEDSWKEREVGKF